jgi:hypothetical protein
MTKLLRITGAVLFGLIFSAPGCEGPGAVPQDNAALIASRDSIRDEFTSDHLTDTDLHAFEENARLKLSEFADYFNISADPALDTAFRMEARRMIGGLFLPGKGRTFLEFCRDYSACRISFDSIRLAEPLRLRGEAEYRGLLETRQTSRSLVGKDTIITRHPATRVEIVAAKTAKVFGRDTLNVWELFLGDIAPGL